MLTYQSQRRENPLVELFQFQSKWKKALSTIMILGALTFFLFILTPNPQSSKQRMLESGKSKDNTSMYAQASLRAETPQPPPQTQRSDDNSGSHPVAVEPKPLGHAAQSQDAESPLLSDEESPSICSEAPDLITAHGMQFYNAVRTHDGGYIRDSFLSEACCQDQMPSMNGGYIRDSFLFEEQGQDQMPSLDRDFTVTFNTKINPQLETLSVVLTTFDIGVWLIRKFQEPEFVSVSENALRSNRSEHSRSKGRLWKADRVKKKIGCKLECVLRKKYRCECINENWDLKNRSGTFEYRCLLMDNK